MDEAAKILNDSRLIRISQTQGKGFEMATDRDEIKELRQICKLFKRSQRLSD